MGAFVTTLVSLALGAGPGPATPRIAGNASPNASIPTTYVFSGGTRYRCAVDAAALHPCARRITLRLAAGTHVLRVQAVDKAGRRSTIARLTIVSRAPVTELSVRKAWQLDIDEGTGVTDIPAVSVGPDGSVYTADVTNNRVRVFDPAGKLLRQWGSTGAGPGQFDFSKNTYEDVSLGSIAVDRTTGAVYVAETQRIQKFDSEGHQQLAFGTSGIGNGQFLRVIDIATDGAGDLYTAEDRPKTLGRAQKFSPAGAFVTTFGRGQIQDTGGVAVDGGGRVLVSDDLRDTILVFSADGRLIRKFGEPGNAPGQLNFPTAMTIVGNLLYVADTDHSRIVRFDLATGRPTGYWPIEGRSYSIAADSGGAVYVAVLGGVLTKYVLPS